MELEFFAPPSYPESVAPQNPASNLWEAQDNKDLTPDRLFPLRAEQIHLEMIHVPSVSPLASPSLLRFIPIRFAGFIQIEARLVVRLLRVRHRVEGFRLPFDR